jgi:hypothetical protein
MGCLISHSKVQAISDNENERIQGEHWSYNGSCGKANIRGFPSSIYTTYLYCPFYIGPTKWRKNYPKANGNHQSPINIKTKIAVYDENLIKTKSLMINYDPLCCEELSNNGHTFQISCNGGKSKIEGGPLKNPYSLLQFHFHWGKTNSEGSEHLIDNKSYASEVCISNDQLISIIGHLNM